VLLLLGREVQFLLDPLDIAIAVGNDLFGGQRRLTGLGEDGRLLGAFRAFGGLRAFRRIALLGVLRRGLLTLRLPTTLAPPVRTPVTPVTTPTTPPIAPPSTPPTGPAALLPSRAPFSTP